MGGQIATDIESKCNTSLAYSDEDRLRSGASYECANFEHTRRPSMDVERNASLLGRDTVPPGASSASKSLSWFYVCSQRGESSARMHSGRTLRSMSTSPISVIVAPV